MPQQVGLSAGAIVALAGLVLLVLGTAGPVGWILLAVGAGAELYQLVLSPPFLTRR